MNLLLLDGEMLHHPQSNIRVILPQAELSIGNAGTMSFSVDPTHPLYNKLVIKKSIVEWYKDNSDSWELFWTGRISEIETDSDKIKLITVEGRLSDLNDSVQLYRKLNLTGEEGKSAVQKYLEEVISVHNSQVTMNTADNSKTFKIGTVTVEDSNDYIYKNLAYDSTYQNISDDLLDTYGGYLRVRYVNGDRYLDYVNETDYGKLCNQAIEYSNNLIELSSFASAEELSTILLPLGAKEEDSERRLTIESENDGNPFLYSNKVVDNPVDLYGHIVKVVMYDDITTAANLKRRANKDLLVYQVLNTTINITAVDLAECGIADVNRIDVGDRITVKSWPHGVDASGVIVTERTYDFDNPENDNLTLSVIKKGLTKIINQHNKVRLNVELNAEEINQIKQLVTQYQISITENIDSVSAELTEKVTAIDGDIVSINSAIAELTTKDFTLEFQQQVDNNIETIQSQINDITTTYHIDADGISIGKEFEGATSAFDVFIDNTGIYMRENGSVVAQINDHLMKVKDAEIEQSLRISNYRFIPRTTGNMSLVWIEEGE